MRQELDEALCRDFPKLYLDRRADCRTTCMCWGFPGDGWEPLIRRLSEKLEKLIEQQLRDNPRMDCVCGHSWAHHSPEGEKTPCKEIWKIPLWKTQSFYVGKGYCPSQNKLIYFFQRLWSRFQWKVLGAPKRWWHRLGWWLAEHTPFYKLDHCDCTDYYPNHSRASQVKEKFATLRFYMTSGTDEMYKLISEAEAESAKTCEQCGKPGKLRGGGWLLTLCDECAAKEGRPDYEAEEDEEDEGDSSCSSCQGTLLDIRFQVEAPTSGDTKNT